MNQSGENQHRESINPGQQETRFEALKHGALAGITAKIVGEILLLMDGRFEHAYRVGNASGNWQFKKLHLMAMMEYPWLTPALFGLLVGLATYYSSPRAPRAEDAK